MRRQLFGIPAILGLVLGMAAGLARVGVLLPGASLAALHGPLMVGGFLGTVIGLERAVALGKRWGYLAPGLCGLGCWAWCWACRPAGCFWAGRWPWWRFLEPFLGGIPRCRREL